MNPKKQAIHNNNNEGGYDGDCTSPDCEEKLHRNVYYRINTWKTGNIVNNNACVSSQILWFNRPEMCTKRNILETHGQYIENVWKMGFSFIIHTNAWEKEDLLLKIPGKEEGFIREIRETNTYK